MALFHVDTDTLKRIDELYSQDAIESKESFVELGLAVGLAMERTRELERPKPFHTLQEMDPNRSYSLIASTRNTNLVTDEHVSTVLEQYAEAGMRTILANHVKKGAINYYEIYRKYSQL